MLLLTCLLLFLSYQRVVQALSIKQARGVASHLDAQLRPFSERVMGDGELLKAFEEFGFEPEEILNGETLRDQLKASMDEYFESKYSMVNEFAAHAKDEYKKSEKSLKSSARLYSSVNEISSQLYIDSDNVRDPKYKNIRLISHRQIVIGKSTVTLPDESYKQDQRVIESVLWSAQLEKYMIEKLKNNTDIRRIFFGSVSGVYRSYPGVNTRRREKGHSLDPRLQDWFFSHQSYSRNFIFIIDVSASMNNDKLAKAKEIATTLIRMLDLHLRVYVITSASTVWSRSRERSQHNARFLSCSSDHQYYRERRSLLLARINQLKADGGSDHTEAFKLAFSTVDRLSPTDCESVIIFITDGMTSDSLASNRDPGLEKELLYCSAGNTKLKADSEIVYTPGDPCRYNYKALLDFVSLQQQTLSKTNRVRIFSFVVGDKRSSDTSLPGSLVCENGGTMEMGNHTDLFVSLRHLMKSFSTERNLKPLHTSHYISPIDRDVVQTFSIPLQINNREIGVVGIDVSVFYLRQRLHGSLGSFESAGAFLVNRVDATSPVHPLLQYTHSKFGFLQSMSFFDLEKMTLHEIGLNEENVEKVKEAINCGCKIQMKIETGAVVTRYRDHFIESFSTGHVSYYFADVQGASYAVGLRTTEADNHYRKLKKLEEKSFNPLARSYLHSLLIPSAGSVAAAALAADENTTQLREDINELAATTDSRTGENVSLAHSTVALTRDAFCGMSGYDSQWMREELQSVQEALNRIQPTDPSRPITSKEDTQPDKTNTEADKQPDKTNTEADKQPDKTNTEADTQPDKTNTEADKQPDKKNTEADKQPDKKNIKEDTQPDKTNTEANKQRVKRKSEGDIEPDSEGDIDIEDPKGCDVIDAQAKRDVVITRGIEDVWRKREEEDVARILSSRVMTRAGVVRRYPGVSLLDDNSDLDMSAYNDALTSGGLLSAIIMSRRELRNKPNFKNGNVVSLTRAVLQNSKKCARDTICSDTHNVAAVAVDLTQADFDELIKEWTAGALSDRGFVCDKATDCQDGGQHDDCINKCYVMNSYFDCLTCETRRTLVSTFTYLINRLTQLNLVEGRWHVDKQATCNGSQVFNQYTEKGGRSRDVDIRSRAEFSSESRPIRQNCAVKVYKYRVLHEAIKKRANVVQIDLSDDSCYSGLVTLARIPHTTLYLLYIERFRNLTRNPFNFRCINQYRAFPTTMEIIEPSDCLLDSGRRLNYERVCSKYKFKPSPCLFSSAPPLIHVRIEYLSTALVLTAAVLSLCSVRYNQ